ncbi:hypothetical protein Hanom_Chr16g01436261 [Helianthus anomalus]
MAKIKKTWLITLLLLGKRSGMNVFIRSKKDVTDDSDVLGGVSKDEEGDGKKGTKCKWVKQIFRSKYGKSNGRNRRKSDRNKNVDNTIPSFNFLSQSSQSSPEPDVDHIDEGIREVDLNEPLNDDEKLIWQYLMTTIDDKQRAERKKDSEEDQVVDIAKETREVELTFTKNIFEASHGLTTRAYLINTLEEGKWISQNVIDCWAKLMNYNEMKINPLGKKWLCCYTMAIVSVSCFMFNELN